MFLKFSTKYFEYEHEYLINTSDFNYYLNLILNM